MRAAGALFCDDGHRGWSDSSQTKFAMFLVVLSCADSEPRRRQCVNRRPNGTPPDSGLSN
jgi:hypothetical protein